MKTHQQVYLPAWLAKGIKPSEDNAQPYFLPKVPLKNLPEFLRGLRSIQAQILKGRDHVSCPTHYDYPSLRFFTYDSDGVGKPTALFHGEHLKPDGCFDSQVTSTKDQFYSLFGICSYFSKEKTSSTLPPLAIPDIFLEKCSGKELLSFLQMQKAHDWHEALWTEDRLVCQKISEILPSQSRSIKKSLEITGQRKQQKKLNQLAETLCKHGYIEANISKKYLEHVSKENEPDVIFWQLTPSPRIIPEEIIQLLVKFDLETWGEGGSEILKDPEIGRYMESDLSYAPLPYASLLMDLYLKYQNDRSKIPAHLLQNQNFENLMGRGPKALADFIFFTKKNGLKHTDFFDFKLAPQENPKPKPLSQNMLIDLTNQELRRIKKLNPREYVRLKKEYIESLDQKQKGLISDFEKRMQPEHFDNHLQSRIITFMLENPSAWKNPLV